MPDTTSDHRLVLDLETTLEGGLTMVGCFSLLIALCFGIDICSHSERGAGDTMWVVLALVALTAVSWLLRWLLDEHYILDFEERKLFFHRGFAGLKSITPVASFEQFLAFAVQGSYQQSKYSSWWEYTPVLVTRDKRILRLADAGRDEEGFHQAGERARELAERTGVACHPPEPERILKAVAPGPTLVYLQRPSHWPWVIGIIVVSLAIGIFLAVYLK